MTKPRDSFFLLNIPCFRKTYEKKKKKGKDKGTSSYCSVMFSFLFWKGKERGEISSIYVLPFTSFVKFILFGMKEENEDEERKV